MVLHDSYDEVKREMLALAPGINPFVASDEDIEWMDFNVSLHGMDGAYGPEPWV